MRFVFLTLFCGLCCLPVQAQSLGPSVAKFGFDYFRRESGNEKNVVLSPLSIHAAFSMLALGAREESYEEARRVLRLPSNFTKEYSEFLETLSPEVGTLKLASNVWPSASFKLHPSYLSDALKAFAAQPESLDFNEPEAARKTINAWVEERTEELISELIPAGGITEATDLVLSNALYFQGQWVTPFRESMTKEQTFYSPKGELQVPTMRGVVAGRYYGDENLELVSLPYEASSLSMAFFVPRSKNGWSKLRGRVERTLLAELERSGEKRLDLCLPKFKVSQESEPIATLKSMGMISLLGSNPNLEGLSPQGGLQVSDCFHQAVVEVDEKGTKAAAATAIVTFRSVSTPEYDHSVRIDRPFFFAIYHRDTLALLFVGQVLDPLEQ